MTMKPSNTSTSSLRWVNTALLAGAFASLTVTSCTTISGTGDTTVYESPDSLSVVDTFKATATVTAINPKTRKLGLRTSDGRRTTVTCGPDVRNFSQIKVNDRVDLSIAEEYAVFLGQGKPTSAAAAALVGRAPLGAKPTSVVVETVEVNCKVRAVDPSSRKVVLELPGGSMKTVKADTRVDLSHVKFGSNVTVQHTEAIAVSVGAP